MHACIFYTAKYSSTWCFCQLVFIISDICLTRLCCHTLLGKKNAAALSTMEQMFFFFKNTIMVYDMLLKKRQNFGTLQYFDVFFFYQLRILFCWCFWVTPNDVMAYTQLSAQGLLWMVSGDHIEFWGSNLGWLCAMTYLLYYHVVATLNLFLIWIDVYKLCRWK